MANHLKLKVWHRAMALSLAVHRAAAGFPPRVAPGLRNQLLRAVASIPSNIAEGASEQPARFAHFLTIAIGSANEAETNLHLAIGLGMLTPEVGEELLRELDGTRRMMFGLRKRMQANSTNLV